MNRNGVVHSGVLFTMVDTAMGQATMTTLEPGQECASIREGPSIEAAFRSAGSTPANDSSAFVINDVSEQQTLGWQLSRHSQRDTDAGFVS